ncbi:MAG: PQQ-like beta-propeller repeat protein [Pseudomonadales bacterium]|nr:PQQ-like beta-propeller repeat protein [Pseudomonadales bacterium]
MSILKNQLKANVKPAALALFSSLFLAAGCSKPVAKDFEAPEKTNWKPVGDRMAPSSQPAALPLPLSWKTMHSDTANSDNVWIASAPMFEFDWVAETDLYIPEGPTFDRHGNLYVSPLQPPENISLVSLDGVTGERRWTIPGEERNSGSGAILILNDPDTQNTDMIYHSTYVRARAITTDGNILWETPTGLTIEPLAEGETDSSHSFGMNYHPQTDSVIGVTLDGHVFAMDRKTGVSRNALLQLPGAPTPPSDELPAPFILNLGDKATDEAFGKLSDGRSLFTTIVDVIFGGSGQVTNYFGIDPNTGKIYIAATAPDDEDGVIDQVSEFGAIYLLDLKQDGDQYYFEIENYAAFEGGTGSTPSISPDSSRVMVSDSANNVIALDAHLNELWRLDVGEQLAASIAISPDSREIYAVTANNVIKIIDHATYAEIAWKADLDAFKTGNEFNALTPTITANGVVVSIGAGYGTTTQQLMLSVGMGLLDRETGKLRYFAEGREESIAVASISPDGGIYTANSPVRRAVGRGLFPNLTPPLVGGVSRYKPIRQDLLVRDAGCAANDRLENYLNTYTVASNSSQVEQQQIHTLLEQSLVTVPFAEAEGSLSESQGEALETLLEATIDALAQQQITSAQQMAAAMCNTFN